MNNEKNGHAHWSFWAISIFAVIWNVLGSMNYLSQMDADLVASLPETHRAIIESRPVWATGGFAVSVFGGALGGLLLLLGKPAAIYLFVGSLLGTIVTMIHTGRIASSTIDFSSFEIVIMIIMPLVVAAFLIWYSSLARSRRWIS